MGFAGRIPGLQREKAPGPLTRLAPCRPQGAEGESAGQRSPQLTWAPGGARPARLGQVSAPPSGARLLTAAEAPMGRAAGPRPLSQRSRRAWWGLRFPWQQHGLKFVQALEGRSERALLWDGLLRGRGGGHREARPPRPAGSHTQSGRTCSRPPSLQRPWVDAGSRHVGSCHASVRSVPACPPPPSASADGLPLWGGPARQLPGAARHAVLTSVPRPLYPPRRTR